MSKLKKGSGLSSIGALTSAVAAHLNRQGSASIKPGLSGVIASLESIDATSAEFAEVAQASENVEGELKDLAADQQIEVTEAGLESAAIAALAVAGGDARGYILAGRNARPSTEGIAVHGALPGYDDLAAAQPALEAFDNSDLSKFSAHTIAYNLLAPRQDDFAAKFFPLIVQTPDQAFFRAEIRRVSVYQGAFHKLSGERTNFQKRNLVEAFRDPSVLENKATLMVPFFSAGDTDNNSRFVDPAVIPTWNEDVDGVEVPTGALRFNQGEFSFLGLSQHPGLLSSGVFDQSDKIDTNVRLKELFVKVKKGADESIVKFDVSGMASAQFVAAQNAHGQQTRVNFRTSELALTSTMTDLSGAAVPALAGLIGKSVARIKVKIDGDLHLEFGTADLSGGAPTIDSLFDSNGTSLVVAGHAMVAGVTLELVGYTLDARRTNSNRRSRGNLLDRDVYHENYHVGLLPPIVVQRSQLDDSTENDVDALVSTTHLLASNMAVTTILAYAETLRTVSAGIQVGLTAPVDGGSLQGISRTLLTPYYKEEEIDLDDVLNNVSSADKVDDIRGYLTARLANAAYEMAQNSGYVAAMKLVNGASEAKPCVLIGCDQVLENYIMIPGDDRTFGPGFEYEVVTTQDMRFYDTIVMTFHDKGAKDFAPLNFGNCIWIPELVASLPTARNGANLNETMVQPRFRHICNLPVMAKFTVKNLDKIIKNRTRLLVDNLEVVNP